MAEQTQNPELVNVTIDGVPMALPKGTTNLDAAARVGLDILH